jgi:ABC-type amino acid transport system permease subunit
MWGNFDYDVIVRSLPFLWKGMQYTIQLTLVAMVGGIFFGTLLAMARLSSIKPLGLRQFATLDSAGAGDLLDFFPRAICARPAF